MCGDRGQRAAACPHSFLLPGARPGSRSEGVGAWTHRAPECFTPMAARWGAQARDTAARPRSAVAAVRHFIQHEEGGAGLPLGPSGGQLCWASHTSGSVSAKPKESGRVLIR